MYLIDILAACDAAAAAVSSCTEEQSRTTRLIRAAVERELSIIGEAVNQMLKQEPALASRITDPRGIIHVRNLVIHAYDLVDPAIIRNIVIDDVPTLRAEVAALLAERATGRS